MRMKRPLWFCLVPTIVLAMAPAIARSAPDWNKLIPFKRIEADPEKEYTISEENGPWMIFVASFAGDGAEKEANDLVLELRKRYKLEAFLHRKHYDYRDAFDGLGIHPNSTAQNVRARRMVHQQRIAFNEIAVLIGDYESVDDPAAQKNLKTVKHARPECMDITKGRGTTSHFSGLRAIQRRLSPDQETKKKGPLGHAFVTRNPVLPDSFFTPKGLDEFVLGMNKNVEHNLLDCPGRYSVRIATFRGNVVIDQRTVDDIQTGRREFNSRLDEAIEKAHRMTLALRERGVEAYEFHDRYESVVTVGSFNTVGMPRADGKIEIDPAVHRVIKAFSPVKQPLKDGYGRQLAGLKPRMVANIPCDVQPVPVEVPRRSVGRDYASSHRLLSR